MSCEMKKTFVLGNIFIRPMPLPKAGMVVNGHKHNFDHATQVLRGSILVKAKRPDGTVIERRFDAPDYFLVRADTEHEITALADNTLAWCVFSNRMPDGEVVQQYTGWEEAYM